MTRSLRERAGDAAIRAGDDIAILTYGRTPAFYAAYAAANAAFGYALAAANCASIAREDDRWQLAQILELL